MLNQLFSDKLAPHGATASRNWSAKHASNERHFSQAAYDKAKKKHDNFPSKKKVPYYIKKLRRNLGLPIRCFTVVFLFSHKNTTSQKPVAFLIYYDRTIF
ncbi:hypothetical protein HB884_16240 [Listeria booriae]|uniref:hypothetical protein n=1 Tax=Listeria booriae TaxID=1552123 RepID=UPI001629985A|nr:hypothetical protein [Listeria booriae]MBC1525757.1 hypothetical protein [Listeria booriae]